MAFSAMSASESFSTRFPLKLWRLLNRCNSGAICWAEHGRSIRIDRRRFEREYLMPVDSAFKTSNFSSFVRQLNLYGFRKVINTFRFNQPPEPYGEVDIHEYHHPFFRRGHPDLLNRVQRRMKGKKTPPFRPDMDSENSSLLSSILKPLNHSTPKEHGRCDRPPLHIMEMNAPVLRYPGVRLDNTAAYTSTTWSGCPTMQKPITPAIFPSTVAPNQRVGMETALYIPSIARSPQTGPSNYRLHMQPAVHPGLPVVEAIQQVLGEKTLSEMVLPSTMTAVNSSLYHTSPAPALPVLGALCAPQKTTFPLNMPPTSITSMTTDSFLPQTFNVEQVYSLKPSVPQSAVPLLNAGHFSPLTQSIPPTHHGHSPLSGSGDLAPLSQLSSLQDSVMSHLVNLCPPLNSQVHTNTSVSSLGQAQASLQSVPVSATSNTLVHLNPGMPIVTQSQRFYSTSLGTTMPNLQTRASPISPADNSSVLQIRSSAQTAMPSPANHQKSLHGSPDSTASPLINSPTCTTPASMPPTSVSYSETYQRVPDSSQSPDDDFTVCVAVEEPEHVQQEPQPVTFKLEVSSGRATPVDRSPNPMSELLDGTIASDAPISMAATVRDAPTSLPMSMSLSSDIHFSLSSTSTDSIAPTSDDIMHQDAASFLRKLSEGALDPGMHEDTINMTSSANQFHDQGQNSVRNQDFFMPTIKMEMP